MPPSPTPTPPRGAALAEFRALLVLGGPLAITQVGQHLMMVVDTAMLGRYHEHAMAGAGIAGGAFFAVLVIGLGVLLGLDTLVPQALGAGLPDRAGTFYRAGVRLAAWLTLPLAALVVVIALALPHAGLEPAVAESAREYLLWRLPGLWPYLLVAAQRSVLQAHGRTRAIVAAMVLGNLVNFVGDYVFIFGDPGLVEVGLPAIGLPPLGAAGAAIATTLVSIASALYLATASRRVHPRGAPAPTIADVRRLFAIGLPVGLHLLAEVGVFALAMFLAGRLRGHAAAGHQVAIALASLSFASAVGIGAAASVRVGRAVGAGDRAAARRAATVSFVLGTVAMGLAGLVFALAPEVLASWFTGDAAVIAAAVPLIQIAAVFQLSDALQAVGAGVLRGTGDTRAAFVANLVGHYGVGLPIAIGLAFGLGLGAPGLWWGLTAGLTAVALFLVVRFYRLSARPIATSLGPPRGEVVVDDAAAWE